MQRLAHTPSSYTAASRLHPWKADYGSKDPSGIERLIETTKTKGNGSRSSLSGGILAVRHSDMTITTKGMCDGVIVPQHGINLSVQDD